MIPKVKISLILIISALLIFISGCSHESDDVPTGTPASVEYYLGSGWDRFVDGDYDQALSDFEEAASRDALKTEAYLGIAWSFVRLQQYNLAKSNAQSVLSDVIYNTLLDPADLPRLRAESYACIAVAYQGLYAGDLDFTEDAILFADSCLYVDPNFVFSYDPDVDAVSMTVLKANAYFASSDFINAFNTITELPHDPAAYADVIQEIDDDDFMCIDSIAVVDTTTLLITHFMDTTYSYGIEVDDPVTGTAQMTIQNTTVADTVYSDTLFMKIDPVTFDTSYAVDINYTYRYYYDVELVDVFNVKIVESGNTINYFIEDFVQGSNIIDFYGVPIPQEEDLFLVSYMKSPNFADFLEALRQLIDSFDN